MAHPSDGVAGARYRPSTRIDVHSPSLARVRSIKNEGDWGHDSHRESHSSRVGKARLLPRLSCASATRREKLIASVGVSDVEFLARV